MCNEESYEIYKSRWDPARCNLNYCGGVLRAFFFLFTVIVTLPRVKPYLSPRASGASSGGLTSTRWYKSVIIVHQLRPSDLTRRSCFDVRANLLNYVLSIAALRQNHPIHAIGTVGIGHSSFLFNKIKQPIKTVKDIYDAHLYFARRNKYLIPLEDIYDTCTCRSCQFAFFLKSLYSCTQFTSCV